MRKFINNQTLFLLSLLCCSVELGSLSTRRSDDQFTFCHIRNALPAVCPFNDGVCCDDGLHCCPPTSLCETNGTCLFINQPKQIQCQDGSQCPDQSTCCALSSGQYACCPIENAVCCSDHIHCCPENYECQEKHGRCKKKFSNPKEIPCPDGSFCPDGDTCCQLESGDYGCCPLCDAVCCNDHLHCCPHGSTCDVEKGQCQTEESSIPWLVKRPSIRDQHRNLTSLVSEFNRRQAATRLKVSFDDNLWTVCPDGTSFCSSNNSTCCRSDDRSSDWFCCSLDSIDRQRSVEIRSSTQLNSPDRSSTFLTILCPDGISTCLEDTTCCPLSDGTYGCCPYRQATCCADQIHCCPNGYSCDSAGIRCTRHIHETNRTESVGSREKFRQYSTLIRGKDEQLCPDNKTQCPIQSTCCPNTNDGSYSCCPYSKGVCCGNNGSVCCPNKYVCDAAQLSCQLEGDDLRTRRTILLSSEDFYQCGMSDVACTRDQTCCPTYGTSDDQYACCAFANARCCEDGRHCCPSNSICDVQSGGCIQVY